MGWGKKATRNLIAATNSPCFLHICRHLLLPNSQVWSDASAGWPGQLTLFFYLISCLKKLCCHCLFFFLCLWLACLLFSSLQCQKIFLSKMLANEKQDNTQRGYRSTEQRPSFPTENRSKRLSEVMPFAGSRHTPLRWHDPPYCFKLQKLALQETG